MLSIKIIECVIDEFEILRIFVKEIYHNHKNLFFKFINLSELGQSVDNFNRDLILF